MPGRRLDRFKFLPDVAERLLQGVLEPALAGPLRDRHVARTRHALNLSVFRILQNHLHSFSHVMSLSDSYR